jgi:hypothetical protein
MARKDDDDPALRLDHDAEETLEEGMSVEGAEVDQAETLASTGDAEGSFQEIASGSATGVGIDREAIGSPAPRDDGLPADADDPNDGDDSWLQDLPRDLT